MSIMTATGRGAQAGVLIKDAEVLERSARVDTLIVDKTGTLIEGRPTLTDIVTANGIGEGIYCLSPPGWKRVPNIRWQWRSSRERPCAVFPRPTSIISNPSPARASSAPSAIAG